MGKIKGQLVGPDGSMDVELEKYEAKPPVKYRPKTINMDTMEANMRQNPLGDPYIAEMLREERQAEMIKNPRLFRKDGTYISR